MKRLTLLAAIVIITFSAWSHTNYEAPELAHMPIVVSKDTSLVMMRYYPDSGVYDLLLIYDAQHDGAGNIKLKGIAEAKFRGYGDSHFTKNTPEDIVIVDAYTDHPRMTGKFNTPLHDTKSSLGINPEIWEIAESVSDYHKNPGDYHPDSVAQMSNNAFALVKTYVKKEQKIAYQRYLEQKQQEKERANNSGRILLILLLPLIASIVLGALTSNDRISKNFSKKIRAIAITELVGFVAAICALYAFEDATWWMITLSVLAVIVLLIYNLFFALFAQDHIKQTQQAKLPWPQLIIFGLLSLIMPLCIIMSVAGVISLFKGASYSGNELAGFISSIALLGVFFLVAMWYRSALVKRMPSLKGDFWALAVMTAFTFLAILSFIFVIIGICISKGVFKMGINEMVNGGSKGVVSTSGTGVASCANCKRLGSECPYSREMGSPIQVCSYHVYR